MTRYPGPGHCRTKKTNRTDADQTESLVSCAMWVYIQDDGTWHTNTRNPQSPTTLGRLLTSCGKSPLAFTKLWFSPLAWDSRSNASREYCTVCFPTRDVPSHGPSTRGAAGTWSFTLLYHTGAFYSKRLDHHLLPGHVRHTQDSTALSVSPREMSRRMDPVLGVRGHVVVHITSLGIAYDQIVPVLLGGARARGRAHYYLGVIYVPALYSRRVHI